MTLKTAMATVPVGVDSSDRVTLLNMCDSVRASLTTSNSLGRYGVHLIKFLQGVLADEVHETAGVLSFDTILEARLDRLLDSLLDPLNKPPELLDSHRVALTAASTLQKQWKARFKERYAEIEDVRNHITLTTGRLRGVSFVEGPAGNGISRWAASEPSENLPELEGSTQFEPGQQVTPMPKSGAAVLTTTSSAGGSIWPAPIATAWWEADSKS